MSLVRPKSRCPACAASIRATDNVPILGWLRLRGRCRMCGAPISVRYPLVEGLVAILLLALVWCEVYAGGINLPGGQADHLATNPLLWRWDLAAIIRCAYHAFLLLVAVAVGWMAWDGFPPPRQLAAVTLLLGIAVPVFVPDVWPVESDLPRWLPVLSLPIGPGLIIDWNSLTIAATGLVGGLLAGGVLTLATTKRFDAFGVLFLATLSGLYLGWRAMATYALIAGGLALAAALVSRKLPPRIPVTATCVVALVIQVFAWRFLAIGIDALADWFAAHGIVREFVPVAAMLFTLFLAVETARTSAAPMPRNEHFRHGSNN